MAVIDIWSGADHKDPIGTAPGWASDEDQRRLNFYATARAYIETVARLALADSDDDQADEWQEYGDPGLLVDTIASRVLGDTIGVSIDGANTDPPSIPDISNPPEPPDETGVAEIDRVNAEVYQAALEVWAIRAAETLDEWRGDIAAADRIVERIDYLEQWARRSGYWAAIVENETENIVPLGSGVYVYGWDAAAETPDFEIYEPDAYFPELSGKKQAAFPDRVHLIWTYSEKGKDWTQRITYELVPVEQVEGAPPILYETGDASMHCVKTHEVFPANAFKDPYGPNKGGVIQETDDGTPIDRLPQGLDFIPVLHVPHTLSRSTHYGRSALGRLFQLLDEIAANDVDESLSSRWAAQPPIGISGMQPGDTDLVLTRGMGVRLKEGGGLYPVNMAQNLEVIVDRGRNLLKRLSVSAQVPEGLVGRVDASEVPSGVALVVSYVAFSQMIKKARLAREDKYRLGWKMIQRIAVQNGDPRLTDGTVYPAAMQFGPFLPTDLPTLVETLTALIGARLISQETAVAMLIDAGVPAESAREEIARIRAIMFAEADQLTGAVEDPKAAAKFLGRPEYRPSSNGVDPLGGIRTETGATV